MVNRVGRRDRVLNNKIVPAKPGRMVGLDKSLLVGTKVKKSGTNSKRRSFLEITTFLRRKSKNRKQN